VRRRVEVQRDGHAQKGDAAVTGDPLTGRLLDGRYRVGSRIARGGMASVYEATDVRLDRQVAVKVMHPGLGDDNEFAARFVREARAAARLSHPNVVAVYDQGDDDGTVFLAMEMVQGHTLRDVIRKESPMSPPRAVAVLEPVLSALAAAHRAGLIHRDVKPENVLIADDGRVKVADFGLAKAISTDTQHTATGGVLIGTVSYLAPELVVDGRADARADVYAAGVVLYELLTGKKPHEGDSPIHVAYKHVHEDVPPPSAKAPEVPGYVDALVARATARDQVQRPADAGVMLHHLHRVSQALASGVRDDPDLEADLAPRALPVVVDPGTGRSDTAPDPLDGQDDSVAAAELAALMASDGGTGAGGREHTAAIDRNPTHERVQVDSVPPLPDLVEPELPPERRRPRRSKRGPLILLLAVLLVAGAGFGAWWYGWARYTSTPGVIGLTQAAAVERLHDAGLDTELGEKAYSETVPEGRVIETDPPAGDRVLDGGTVTLVVSRGKERYDVPQLREKTEDQAQDSLTRHHLEFGESTGKYSEKVPKDRVIATDPEAGTTLRPGAVVDLILSKGPRPIKVGDWVGKDADHATQVLEKRGLEVDSDQEAYSDDIPEGAVISQIPSGGTLFRGEKVTFVVSLGPELVQVPDGLVASGVDAARQKLEDAGFEVDLRRAPNYLGIGYVYRVDPPSGTLIPKGSTVTLFII
jgi:beta-lactam-binding protein with PASTA domain/tRNA A-37 threonylcarbamoyl transferase component Bud32